MSISTLVEEVPPTFLYNHVNDAMRKHEISNYCSSGVIITTALMNKQTSNE